MINKFITAIFSINIIWLLCTIQQSCSSSVHVGKHIDEENLSFESMYSKTSETEQTDIEYELSFSEEDESPSKELLEEVPLVLPIQEIRKTTSRLVGRKLTMKNVTAIKCCARAGCPLKKEYDKNQVSVIEYVECQCRANGLCHWTGASVSITAAHRCKPYETYVFGTCRPRY